jgi:hypothetical protein
MMTIAPLNNNLYDFFINHLRLFYARHPMLTTLMRGEMKSTTLQKMRLCGSLIGLCGGVAVALLGALLTTAAWFERDAIVQRWLSTAGTVLLCSTIPLIILGAFCLDWLEKDKSQRWSKDSYHEDESDEL